MKEDVFKGLFSREAHADEGVLLNTQGLVLLDYSYLLGRKRVEGKCSGEEETGEGVDGRDIPDILHRTSQTIRDIDTLVTAAMQPPNSHD